MLALWVILALAALFGWARLCRWLLDNPREDVETGLFWHFLRGYLRFMHRPRLEGLEHIPRARQAGPLIIVSNHTAGVDPLLIQVVCPFEIRWIMASDMRHPAGEWFWKWARIIFVDRQSGEATGAREAIRHLKAGGVIGIFPEGGIERPARALRRFHAGVGFIIRRSGAPVLPVIIEGTPAVKTAWGSLVTRGHARVRVLEPVRFEKGSPEEIAGDLRRRYQAWTGWPLNDE